MAFRPCIDLRGGKVVQIVGGTLTDAGVATVNYESELPPSYFASRYHADGLLGGHVIMLGSGNEAAALEALAAYPVGLQAGGGIRPDNALRYLDAGASHVIVTSYLFVDAAFSWERLAELTACVGRDRLVIDLSCRRSPDGAYYVATDRWQTVTSLRIDAAAIASLEPYCAEFLVHAADVEGKQAGIDEDLVRLLGTCVRIPTTYAGGAKALEDVARVEELSGGKLDLTIGSALDIFGGKLVRYEEAAKLGRIRGGDAGQPGA
jgi:phosphoribosylformimino-5-aminoimidazole carboxamide ribotide isomerase